MQVLHICPYMHPSAGGPPVVVERLAALAPKHSWKARVITTSLFCDDKGSSLERELNQSIDAQVLTCDRRRLAGVAAEAAAAIEMGVRDSDLVHLHTLWHPFNTLARRACTKLKRPYVVTPHGMLDPYSLSVRRLRKQLYLWLREKSNLVGASCLIFTTPLEQQLARSGLPWLPQGEIIALGADRPPDVSRDDLASLFRNQFPAAAGRRSIVFLGRVHPKKGLELIIKSLPTVIAVQPDLLLVVAGSGEASYIERLRREIRRQSLCGHVLFTGPLGGEMKWGTLAAADLFLLPSLQENFAIAVAEAMHMAVPVLISDKVNTWPFVSEARAGVVLDQLRLSREFAAAIVELLDDRQRLREMGNRGRQFAQQNFTWENTATRTFALYERLLALDVSTTM